MKQFSRLLSLATASVLMVSGCTGTQYCKIEGYAQGGVYRITLNTTPSKTERLKAGIDSILNDIDYGISGYNKDSELTKANNSNCFLITNRYLSEIIDISADLYHETDGRFDPSAGALFDIWGFGFKEGKMPGQKEIDSIKVFSGMDKIRMSGDTLYKSDRRTTLNFNAIAQGYSCDVVAGYLKSEGITDMLIDIGGEIYCSGKNPKGGMWSIGIDSPVDGNMERGADIEEIILIDGTGGKGVVTSGNYRKYYVRDGRKYAHTIDPATGYPVNHNLLSATVIAPNATMADALATYIMVIGFEEGSRYIVENGLEGVLIYEKDGKMNVWKSNGTVTKALTSQK